MKILIICLVRFNINGISTFISNFVSCIQENKEIDIKIVCNEFADKSFLDKFSKILYVLPSRKKHLFKYIKSLKSILRKKFDIIYIHGNSATMILETKLCRKSCKKLFVHGHNVSSNHNFLNKVLKRVFNSTFDIGFACSQEAGNFLFYKKDFIVIKNGIKIDKFKFSIEDRQLMREKYHFLKSDKILLCVGRLNNQKNQEFLLKVAKSLPIAYKIVLVGDGDNYEKLLKLKIDNNISNVFFLGKSANASPFYSMSDCLLVPSLYESFGIVVLEAQINGLTCICSEFVSRSSDILKKNLYLPLNENEWIECIIKNKYQRIYLQNYEEFQLYDERNVTNDILNIFRNSLTNNIGGKR